MSLEMLQNKDNKTVGTKQTLKALTKNSVSKVFLAKDADKRVVGPLLDLCQANHIIIEEVESMTVLGKACRVDVPTAAAALLL